VERVAQEQEATTMLRSLDGGGRGLAERDVEIQDRH